MISSSAKTITRLTTSGEKMDEMVDLKRYDLNILSKDDPHFQSFRKALDSRMKELTSAGIGTKRYSADPLTMEDEEQLCNSLVCSIYTLVCFIFSLVCSIWSILMSSYFTPQFPCASEPPSLYIV